jgi:ABC-2 type transport system ATP-binding protein
MVGDVVAGATARHVAGPLDRRPVPAISVERLSKSFGSVRAVSELSFTAEPGTVTGFLGPNGAGKTTTLRTILGLVTPTQGRTLIGDRPYVELERPAEVVGAVLEATGFHPGRSARDHLRVVCAAAGLPVERVDEVLAFLGLEDAAGRTVGGYSLGMRQRLSLATALLGRPPVLILDEPMNGLDPGGIHALRRHLRRHADEGGTVLLSSHVLSEVEQTVDRVVIVHEGRLVQEGLLRELTSDAEMVRVRTPQATELTTALEDRGATVRPGDGGALLVAGATAEDVGRAALAAEVVLTELVQERSGLERVFLDLTRAQLGEGSPEPVEAVEAEAAEGTPR